MNKKTIGVIIALAIFFLILSLPNPEGLTDNGKAALAVFLSAFVLWVTEPFPPYLVALISIIALIITGAWTQSNVLGVFGYDVIWLMVCAFILTSAMQKTNLAKRIALLLIIKFGHTAKGALLSMIIANFILSFLIPSTTARAALLLPIALTIAQVYNAIPGESNLGRLLMLFNMQSNEISTSGIMTATAANVMAVQFIKEATGQNIYYSTWLLAAMPIALISMIFAYFLGQLLFPFSQESHAKGQGQTSRVAESLENLKREYQNLGSMSSGEVKALIVFLITLILWATDRWHTMIFGMTLDATLVAIIGATLAFLPGIGVLKKWEEAKIPWDLMLFSCGAYAVGNAMDKSGAASWVIQNLLSRLDVTKLSYFQVYAVVMFIALFSHIIFTSKTVRITILAPVTIAFAQQIAPILNIDPTKLIIALALPVGFTICWCITLPPQSKPNLIYYSTKYYTVKDQFLFGMLVDIFAYILLLIAGMTWFKVVGIGV